MGPGRADHQQNRLAVETLKEPELVRKVERKVERKQLYIVGLISTHSTGSGAKLPELPRLRGAGQKWGYSRAPG